MCSSDLTLCPCDSVASVTPFSMQCLSHVPVILCPTSSPSPSCPHSRCQSSNMSSYTTISTFPLHIQLPISLAFPATIHSFMPSADHALHTHKLHHLCQPFTPVTALHQSPPSACNTSCPHNSMPNFISITLVPSQSVSIIEHVLLHDCFIWSTAMSSPPASTTTISSSPTLYSCNWYQSVDHPCPVASTCLCLS